MFYLIFFFYFRTYYVVFDAEHEYVIKKKIFFLFCEDPVNIPEVARYGICPQTKRSIHITCDTWLKPPLYADSEYILIIFLGQSVQKLLAKNR